MAQAAITNEIGLCCASLNAVESLNETRNRPIPGVATPPFDSNAPSAMKRSSILQAAGVRLTTALDDEDASVVATARIRFLQGQTPQ